jgi:hypothetical protein
VNARQKRVIREVWAGVEAEDPDASTERIFLMVRERATEILDIELDDGDISEALAGGEV